MKDEIILYQHEYITELVDRIEEYDVLAELIVEDLEALDSLLEVTNTENNELALENAVLGELLSLLIAAFDVVSTDLATAEEDYTELFQEHEDLKEEEAEAVNTLAGLYERHHELIEIHEAKDSELHALKVDYATLESNFEQLFNAYIELQSENNTLKANDAMDKFNG